MSFLEPFALYLQQFGSRTCHCAWYLLHFGLRFCMVFAILLTLQGLQGLILPGMCYMLVLQTFMLISWRFHLGFLEGFISGGFLLLLYHFLQSCVFAPLLLPAPLLLCFLSFLSLCCSFLFTIFSPICILDDPKWNVRKTLDETQRHPKEILTPNKKPYMKP